LIALDTNVVIAAVNNRPPAVRALLADQFGRGTPIWISSVVLFELRYGIAKSGRPDANAAILDVFLAAPVEVVPVRRGRGRRSRIHPRASGAGGHTDRPL